MPKPKPSKPEAIVGASRSAAHRAGQRASPRRRRARSSTRPTARIAAAFFAWMIAPLSVDESFASVYETRPAHLKRPAATTPRGSRPTAHPGLLSTVLAALDGGGRRRVVPRRRALDAQRRRRRRRGRGAAGGTPTAARCGCRGRSAASDGLWAMLAQLEEFFGAAPGADVYATPARMRASRRTGTTSTPSCSSSRARSIGGCTPRRPVGASAAPLVARFCAGRSGRADRQSLRARASCSTCHAAASTRR